LLNFVDTTQVLLKHFTVTYFARRTVSVDTNIMNTSLQIFIIAEIYPETGGKLEESVLNLIILLEN
jgi:hypothetical protein